MNIVINKRDLKVLTNIFDRCRAYEDLHKLPSRATARLISDIIKQTEL